MTVLTAGQEVHGLTIEKELGRGAYGVVYLATDKLLGRLVALKVIAGGGHALEEVALEQVKTEARLIALLRSPYIVSLYKTHPTEDGGWQLELEFVSGGCLDDEWTAGEPFELREAVRIFRGVLLALDSAHAAGVIHGDIKLGNVLFGPDGLVKLADFGMARVLEGTDAAIPLHGEIFGTPLYMAPEILRGEQMGAASDIWAATVLFYQLLTGGGPFPCENMGELIMAIQDGDPSPLPDAIPSGVADVIARGLAKQVGDRFPSAAAVLEQLDELAQRHPELAPRVLASENPTNLTADPTPFVGRESELNEIGDLLHTHALITLAGPGGVGKTRIARQLCAHVRADFPGGTWLADLSAAQSLDDVAHGVARALGIPFASDREPLVVVADALRFRQRHLVVLDNCEHLRAAVREALTHWLEHVPDGRFVVTSRALLAHPQERAYELEPLPVPQRLDRPELAQAREYAGVALFEQRATKADAAFQLDETTLAAVCDICIDLDGMPLGIELAAARCSTMSANEIAEKLGAKFDLLASSAVAVSPRQRTLAGAIEWSFSLLEPWEKQAFLQSTVFRDGFTIESAEAVLDVSAFADAPSIREVLRGLREKSLLTARDAGYGPRLGAYKAIRDFGERTLQIETEAAERESLRRRHAEHFLALAEHWNGQIPGPHDDEAMDRIEVEIGNLRVIESRALEHRDGSEAAEAVLGIAKTMNVRLAPGQLIPLLDAALETLDDVVPETAIRLRNELASACFVGGDWERSRQAAEEAVAMAREIGHAGLTAQALVRHADVSRSLGKLDDALASYREAAERASKSGDEACRAMAVGGGSTVAWQKGQRDESTVSGFLIASHLARAVGDHRVLARYLGNIGVVHESRGELDQAIACHREVEEVSRRKRDRKWVSMSLGNRGTAHVLQGDLEAGVRCYREAEEIARELGADAHVAQLVGHRGLIHSSRDELDAALRCFEESEEISRRIGDQVRLAFALGQEASVYIRREDYPAALEAYREAAEIGVKTGDRQIVARFTCNQGTVLGSMGRPEEGRDRLAEGLAIFDELGASHNIVYFMFLGGLASIERRLGNLEEAQRVARSAVALADALGITEAHSAKAATEALREVRAILEAS